MQSVEVPVPKYGDIPGLRNNKKFKAAVESAIELRNDIAVLEKQLADEKKVIDEIYIAANVEGSVDYNGWRISKVVRTGKPKLNMKKLMTVLGSKGPTIIRQVMDPAGPSTEYIQINPPKKETDE